MLASRCPDVDARWTHEYVPLAAPSRIFWHAEDFAMSPEVDPNAGETQPDSNDGLQCAHECPNVFTIFYNVFTINLELWESVRPA